jgi:YggT family protein
MFVFGNVLDAFASLLDLVLTVYMYIIIVRALISWVNPDPYNPIVQFLMRSTEPVLRPVRRLIPMGRIGIDFSPLIVLFAIIFLRQALVASLHQLAFRMH